MSTFRPRGILDLGDFKAVHLFSLLFRNQINLANAVTILCALKEALQTGQAPALSGPIVEYFPADASGKNAPNNEGSLGIHT